MAGCLLIVAAVLSTVGVVAGNGSLLQWSWVVWGVGVLLLIRNARLRRRYGTPEALKASAEAGDMKALRSLAMLAKLQDDFDEAERLLRIGVAAGDRESMWEMGRLVEHRDGLEASEPWFRMAAERGHWAARRFFRPGHALNLDGTNPLFKVDGPDAQAPG
ncbi:sel1 repeat family protein [Streptomyces sp. NPDC052682]|uniref:sel1 repeat family protein n=1 Tax=Streptomyces sp. NPDC052682 TaxID=3154954 RepID=UPI00343D770F